MARLTLKKPEPEISKTQQGKRLRAVLEATWPDVFCYPPRPLAIGIYKEIKAEMPEVDRKILSDVLYKWCIRTKYKECLATQPRVHLNGELQE